MLMDGAEERRRRRAWQPHRLKLLRVENLLAESASLTEGQSVENTLIICIEIHPLCSDGKHRLQPFLSFLYSPLPLSKCVDFFILSPDWQLQMQQPFMFATPFLSLHQNRPMLPLPLNP